MGDIVLAGATSGTITLQPTAVAGSSTLTLPAANATVITTASGGQSIPKAALPTGSVLQVVEATTTSQTLVNTGNTNTDTALTASITPTSSSSKVLVIISLPFIVASSTQFAYCGFGLKRNSTAIYTPVSDAAGSFTYGISVGNSTNNQVDSVFNLQLLDSPASSSAVSYTVFVNLYSAAGAVVRAPYNAGGSAIQTGVITLMEIAA